jgi:addiction module RelE/StbE family toxin
MLRQIIWTERAQKDRLAIFTYWNIRNGTPDFSRKLNELIKASLELIRKYPLIGKPTGLRDVRVKVLKEYLIIYEISDQVIIVLTLWDCRQNPEDMARIMK